ncbi:MAG TPA: VC0807 family protein [Actinomycetes bacterium]|nr:VC0807 family protein [Actinomycetes bacterium]
MANIVPSVLFYVCLVSLDVWAALVAALAWCYGAMAWRMVTRRRMSMLLLLTLVGLSVRTAVAFASGSTFLYFLQPVLNNTVVALLFLLSLATARPVVARLAADFFPMTDDIAKRPRVERLFWHLTLLWAVVALGKATMTLWLLQSQSVVNFVVFKDTFFLAVTVLALTVTVSTSVWVAGKEGLLHRSDARQPSAASSS